MRLPRSDPRCHGVSGSSCLHAGLWLRHLGLGQASNQRPLLRQKPADRHDRICDGEQMAGRRGKLVLGSPPPCARCIDDVLRQMRQILEPIFGNPGATGLYLCCVNRGVLDDALILAAETDRSTPRSLLEKVTRAVSVLPDAPPCWPLWGEPTVAVWPMDMESLIVSTDDGGPPPAQKILHRAIDASLWHAAGACEAGPRCLFCTSREQLSHVREQTALLAILRWYELGSGKRWSFRDLFSLFSHLLAGHRHETRNSDLAPCAWAASMTIANDQAARNSKPTAKSSTAIFELVMAQYHHALFHS